MPVIKELDISNFRHLKDVKIKFGKTLTVISGLNGTGKSSILGLVGHLFSFRQDDKNKSGVKTLSDKTFETEYSEIFRFCPLNDHGKDYSYNATFGDNDTDIYVKSAKARLGEKDRDRYRIDVGERKKGQGKINYPVIYLSLKRLIPLAQESKIKIEDALLIDSNDKDFFKNEVKEIFVSLDETTDSDHLTTNSKNQISIKTRKYNAYGNSAGQDNISQILTAILSFKKLNSGGILLIDEVEATLFPGAQINLIKRLYSFAHKFKLQIIFTTHSIEIIDFLKNQNYSDVELNFLEIKKGAVINTVNPELDYIKSKILMEAKQEEKIDKINILCEDEVGTMWCKNLINGSSLKKEVSIFSSNISNGGLKDMASKRLSCFKKFIFVLDGDSNDLRFNKSKELLFLPGKKCPETEMYNFFKNLDETDNFWENPNYFDKVACFNGFTNKNDTNGHKSWFNERKVHFGKDCSKLFNCWKSNHENEVKTFLSNLEKRIKEIKHDTN